MRDSITCEPFRVWNRLEPRAREVDFGRALRAEIHDPLWMLARQWQFGEFKGEDTGSAVFAKLAVRQARIDGFRSRAAGAGGFESYDARLPLQVRVEPVAAGADFASQADAGRHALCLIERLGAAWNAAGGSPAYEPAYYRAHLAGHFSFSVPDFNESDPDELAAAKRLRADARAFETLLALAGRAVDGLALYEALDGTPPGTPLEPGDLPAAFALGIVPQHAAFVLQALSEYRDWFAARRAPEQAGAGSWEASQLEYGFECRAPRPDGGALVLSAEAYDSGQLDWYCFDTAGESAGQDGPEPAIQEAIFSVIPAPAEFPGMPNPRWWQLEDADVDLGNIRADSTDIARILIAEFALVYGNNWLVIPCRQEVGTLAEALGIVLTDVFGERTLVRSAADERGQNWGRWSWFALSQAGAAGASEPGLGEHLFIPPAAGTPHDSEPVERVTLLRDEAANMVWGIELRVPDGLGGSRNGNDAARQLKNALVQHEERLRPARSSAGDGQIQAELRYLLATTVAENWIPFLPVHTPGQNRAIRLQRAAMPRFFLGVVRPVRPVTGILRAGLDSSDAQGAPYFVNEEEVLRTGTVVETFWRRARWFGGSTHVWLARRVRAGAGEGSSGLRFDLAERAGSTGGQ